MGIIVITFEATSDVIGGRREAGEYRFQWCRAPKVTRSRGYRRKAYRTPKGPPVDSLSMFESHTPVVCTVDKGTESETTREKAENGEGPHGRSE